MPRSSFRVSPSRNRDQRDKVAEILKEDGGLGENLFVIFLDQMYPDASRQDVRCMVRPTGRNEWRCVGLLLLRCGRFDIADN